jgi:hypothetical protein
VGNQSIRIRSAGAARTDTTHVDAYGRRWQLRSWPLGYTQAMVNVAALPTPNGYVGMIRMSAAATAGQTGEELRTLTDFFQAPLEGTLPQWQAYLARKALRPALFDDVRIERGADGFGFESTRLQARVPGQLLKVSDTGWLRLDMGFMAEGAGARWDVAGLTLAADHGGESYLALTRRVKPDADAGREPQERWSRMLARQDEYDGVTARDPEQKATSVRLALAHAGDAQGRPAPQSAVLYETLYRTTEKISTAEMDQRRAKMLGTVRVLEP